MAKNQDEKSLLSITGEYGVCSELSKRGHHVSLTYGNAKATDIVIFSHNGTGKFCRTVEVKTSRDKKFVTGFFQKYGDKSNPIQPDYWVLVYIDADNVSHYYVLTHEEMGNAQMERNKMQTWEPVKGVDNVLLKDVVTYENAWNKITL